MNIRNLCIEVSCLVLQRQERRMPTDPHIGEYDLKIASYVLLLLLLLYV